MWLTPHPPISGSVGYRRGPLDQSKGRAEPRRPSCLLKRGCLPSTARWVGEGSPLAHSILTPFLCCFSTWLGFMRVWVCEKTHACFVGAAPSRSVSRKERVTIGDRPCRIVLRPPIANGATAKACENMSTPLPARHLSLHFLTPGCPPHIRPTAPTPAAAARNCAASSGSSYRCFCYAGGSGFGVGHRYLSGCCGY